MSENPYLKALEKHKRNLTQSSQTEKKLENTLLEKINNFNWLSNYGQFDEQHDVSDEEIVNLKREIEEAGIRYTKESERRKTGSAKEFGRSILSQSSQDKISSRVNKYAKSPSTLTAAYNVSKSKSSTFIEKKQNDFQEQLEEASHKMRDLVNPETGEIIDEKQFKQYANRASSLEKQSAVFSQAMKNKYQSRDMPIFKTMETDAFEKQIKKEEYNKSVDESIAKRNFVIQSPGSIGTNSNAATEKISTVAAEQSKLEIVLKQLIESNKDLKEAISQGNDQAIEDNAKKVSDATEEAARRKDIVDKLKGAGDPNDFGNKIKNIAGQVGAYANIGSNFIGGYKDYRQQIDINHPLATLDNQTGFMNLQNEQYGDAKAAANGNQMSVLKILSMYSGKKSITSDFMERQQGVKRLDYAEQAAAGIAAGAIAVAAGVDIANPLANKTEAAVTGVSSLATLANIGFKNSVTRDDVSKKVSAGQTALAASSKYKQLFEAMNSINAEQMQTYENQYSNSYTATIGLGTKSSVMGDMTNYGSGSTLKKLASLGISQERMGALVDIGGKTIGGRDLDLKSLETAAVSEKAGVTSSEQYMHLLGAMTDVGGKNQDLHNILKGAVTLGMDDSKSINRMVSATVSLSEKSSLGGLTSAGGVAEMVLKASKIEDSSLSNSQKVKMAMNTVESVNDVMKRGGTDIYSMQELSSIREAVKGTSIGNAGVINLRGLDVAGMANLKTVRDAKKDSVEYKQAVENLNIQGLGDLVDNPDTINKIIKTKTLGTFNKIIGFGTGVDKKDKSFLNDFLLGKKGEISISNLQKGMSKDSFDALKQRASGAGINLESYLSLLSEGNVKKTSLESSTSEGRGVGAGKRALASETSFKEARKGQKILGDITGQADKNKAQSLMTEAVKQNMDANINKSQKQRQSEAASFSAPDSMIKAGAKFSSAAGVFEKSVSASFAPAIASFKAAVDSMVGKAGATKENLGPSQPGTLQKPSAQQKRGTDIEKHFEQIKKDTDKPFSGGWYRAG